METDEREPASGASECTIVKPKPRTPVTPKTPTESELETVPSAVMTSTPSDSPPAAPIGGELGDASPKTDSPSKKKGKPVRVFSRYLLGHSACSWSDWLISDVILIWQQTCGKRDKVAADSCWTSLMLLHPRSNLKHCSRHDNVGSVVAHWELVIKAISKMVKSLKTRVAYCFYKTSAIMLW